MKEIRSVNRQRGVALAIALILLAVITVLSVFGAATGALDLRVSGNMQAAFDSFQQAEAGVAAVVTLSGTGPDPFTGVDDPDPMNGAAGNPLGNLNDGAGSLDLNVILKVKGGTCPRSRLGFSADLIACDHYRVESTHTAADSRSKVDQGVVKSVIGSATL